MSTEHRAGKGHTANGHAWPCPGFYEGNHHPLRADAWACSCDSVQAEGGTKLLDLYCCAGGASMGFHRAGFEVFGVDRDLRIDYPFPSLRGDAIVVLRHLLDGRKLRWWKRDPRTGMQEPVSLGVSDFDAFAASPPCQAHTTLTKGNRGRGWTDTHVDLIAATRDALVDIGRPFIIENVVGARAELVEPVMLCGLSFGLRVFRHRLFESNVGLDVPEHPSHRGHRVAGWRHGVKYEGDMFAVYGTGGGKGLLGEWQAAMGIDWIDDKACLAEAIPPAYTEYLGRQLMAAVEMEAAA